jgi:tetratricopeptide (TPR) repeat protein
MKSRNISYPLAFAVSLLTFIGYLTSLRNEFIGWDDGTYIVENVHIRSLDGTLLKWAFFDFYASNWHPLTWISHALDYAVWGLNPLGHHLTNNILHALNTFLVVLVAVRLIESARHESPASGPRSSFTLHSSPFTLIAAAATGLLFGLHPIHVESVAWVSERKDLLCALFYLLSILSYVTCSLSPLTPPSKGGDDIVARLHSERGMWYLVTLCFFILALLSKPMAVSLPAVLLLLDWYPFEKIRSLNTFFRAVIGKLPFIALSIGSSVLTMLAQEKAMVLMDYVPLPARILVAARSLFAYLEKMLFPWNLSPFYPYSGNVYLLAPEYFISIVLLVVAVAACLIISRKQKIWLSLSGYYVVTLIPVLGIVQVGRQAMADRYAYLPSIAPFLIAGLLAAQAHKKISKMLNPGIKLACTAAAVCIAIYMSYLTYRQIAIWNNTVGFWSYVILREPEVPFAYYGRGLALNGMGQTYKAIEDYDKAISLDPSYFKAYAARGFAYAGIDQLDKAIADYDKAIALNPRDSEAYRDRGVIFEKEGRLDEAIADYDKAIALNPLNADAYIYRGIVLEKIGRYDNAIADYDKAIALNPLNADVYFNRGNAFDELGKFDKAIADYNKAIALNPGDSEAYNNRGLVREKTGQLDKAMADYDKAVALNSSNIDAVNNLRTVLHKKLSDQKKNSVH